MHFKIVIKNNELIDELKQKFNTDRNIVCRYALAFGLNNLELFDKENEQKYSGYQIDSNLIFGENVDLYEKVLIKLNMSDKESVSQLINIGLELLNDEILDSKGIEQFFLRMIEGE
jgi:DNA sulfur modification protein DndE